MASPAALLTLQLYRPLSDTWERKDTVTVYMWLGYLGLPQNIQVSRYQNLPEQGLPKYAGPAGNQGETQPSGLSQEPQEAGGLLEK